MIFLFVGFFTISIYQPADGSFNFKWLFYLLLVICIVAFLFQDKKVPIKLKLLSIAGFIYISLSLGLMISFYDKSSMHFHDTGLVIAYGFFFPALIIASLWVNDTMAYIVGSLIGKTQMSKISPKKTWEGTIGGIVITIVVASLIAWLLDLKIVALAITSAIAAIAGTFGDLLESKLKRMANVKDSGRIMPGHGGFLDRFDSLLIATPFVWLYVQLFMQ